MAPTTRSTVVRGPARILVLASLVTVVALAAWILVVPKPDAPGDEVATSFDGAGDAADAGAAGPERDGEGATLGTLAEEAAFARQEVLPEDDGRARVPAAEVLVLDADGEPLGGAVVEAAAAGARDERTTDILGRTTVRLPPARALDLRARAPGHLPTGRTDHPFGQAATIKMARAARLLATVRDAEGQPVAGVNVAVRGRTRVASATDLAGAVALDAIRPGTYDVALTSAAAAPVARACMVAGLFLTAGDNTHTFVLPRGTTVRGAVVETPSRLPIAGADVDLRWESRGGGVYGFDHQMRTKADADGRFAFTGIAPGRVRVRANTTEHAARVHEQDLVVSSGDVEVVFELPRAAVVRGSVVDDARLPVAGAEVTLCWGENSALRFANVVTADPRGCFEMRDIAPRDGLVLVANVAGRAPGAAVIGKLLPGEVREGVEVAMKRGVAVRGKVVSATGVPLARADVRLVPKLGADRYARATTTDGNGRFWFDQVAAFRYRVEVRAVDHVPLGADVDVREDKSENDAGELRLQRAYVLAGVVVVRGDDVGQGGARVAVREASGKQGWGGGAMTDDLGCFTIADLPEGDYLLDVRGPDVVQQAPQRVRVPQRARLRVPVDAMVPAGTGIIELAVLDPRTRAPVPGVQFGGVDGRRVAYADGAYSLRGIPKGTIELRLRARGYQPMKIPGVVVLPGRVRDLHAVVLAPSAALRVTVVDERGRPFPPGQVRLRLSDTQGLTPAEALAPASATPERGHWTWDGLALSRFELRVIGPPTHAPSVRAIDAFAPQPTDLRVQLARKPKPAPKKAKEPRRGG